MLLLIYLFFFIKVIKQGYIMYTPDWLRKVYHLVCLFWSEKSIRFNTSPPVHEVWIACVEWFVSLCVAYLYCIVLYCIVLYCIVLYCIVLYCIVLLLFFIFIFVFIFVFVFVFYFYFCFYFLFLFFVFIFLFLFSFV